MTTEKMTVHKALAELKVIGDRISSAISTGVYCRANKHSNEKVSGVSVEDFKKQIQGSWDKANDLIKRRNAIKKAVVFSNAITKVKVGEIEFVLLDSLYNVGVDFFQSGGRDTHHIGRLDGCRIKRQTCQTTRMFLFE